jgi:hypothetical protein
MNGPLRLGTLGDLNLPRRSLLRVSYRILQPREMLMRSGSG